MMELSEENEDYGKRLSWEGKETEILETEKILNETEISVEEFQKIPE